MIAVAIKTIPCTNCGEIARLSVWPHPDAGLWECTNCGDSGECEHPELEVENVLVERFGDDMESTETEEQVYICSECGSTIEGIPVEDNTGDCGA